MACNLQSLKGIGEFCETNLAGIKRAWLGLRSGFDITPDSSKKNFIGTMANVEGSSEKLYEYVFAKQTGALTSTITIDEANGVRYYTNEVNLQFNKLEAAKHAEIEALAQSQLVGIILDNNDKYWLVGYDSYLSATAVTAQTGQSFGDLNGYQTTMSAMSANLPFEIEYDTFKALIDA